MHATPLHVRSSRILSGYGVIRPTLVRAGLLCMALWSLTLAGCGDDEEAAQTDAGVVDAGPLDAGVTDSGSADANAADAGTADVGVADVGPSDVGAIDVGKDTFDPAAPACSVNNPKGTAWVATAEGTAPFQVVGDVTLPTTTGDFSLKDSWTGCDSYLFMIGHPDSKYTYAKKLWDTKITDLMKFSPNNVHYVFMSYAQNPADVAKMVEAKEAEFTQALSAQSAEQQAIWKGRFHFVTKNPWQTDGWVASMLKAKAVFVFAIDRLQRRREVGSFQPPGGQPSLMLSKFEATYFNWEWDLHNTLAAEQKEVTEVTIWDGELIGSGWSSTKKRKTVTLPSAKEMEKFDTVELDFAQHCSANDDTSCPDWDRETNIYVCGAPNTDLPGEVTPCTAKKAKQECACTAADGAPAKGQRTCNEAGTGFGACVCPCSALFARHISSYKRQARWVTDLSPLLPMLAKGGKTTFAYHSVDKWKLTGKLRLSNRKKPTKAVKLVRLFTGKQFNEKYNGEQKPVEVEVPKTAKKVRFATILTGHGSGTDKLNCAEFCKHTHHFGVSTGGAKAFTVTKSHANAGTGDGCTKQIVDGMVPNQFGTWPYGRAGWCPGLDVKVWNKDVTNAIKPGEKATFTYQALLGGKVYVPNYTKEGGYKPVIKMMSWAVIEE